MDLKLEKKPKSPIIIEGFPGFGLVGTIVTESLIKHLNAKLIGRIRIDEIPPVIAVHNGEALEPLGIFYDEKYNLLILHALTGVSGFEWMIADAIVKTAKELNAKEIISIEGVGSGNPNMSLIESRAFYISNNKKIKNMGIEELKEGIVVGVTGALLLRKDMPITCIFAETHSTLPDSRAAAKVIEVLDKYLGLKVEYKPLLEKAEKFEGKMKEIIEKTQAVSPQKDRKKLTYFG